MEIPYEYKRLEDCDKEDLITKIIVRENLCDELKELLDKGLKKYKELKEENEKLKAELALKNLALKQAQEGSILV